MSSVRYDHPKLGNTQSGISVLDDRCTEVSVLLEGTEIH